MPGVPPKAMAPISRKDILPENLDVQVLGMRTRLSQRLHTICRAIAAVVNVTELHTERLHDKSLRNGCNSALISHMTSGCHAHSFAHAKFEVPPMPIYRPNTAIFG